MPHFAPRRLGCWQRFVFLCGFVVLLGWAMPSPAAEKATLPDFLLRTWDSDDGLPAGQIRATARTPDGYLWIATTAGLARFDGSRFVVFSTNTLPALGDNRVLCLLVDRAGDLWVGTGKGTLARRHDGVIAAVPLDARLGPKPIYVLAQDAEGAIWLATHNFDFLELKDMARDGQLAGKLQAAFPGLKNIGLVVFFGAFLGFAVKVPVVPFHTWLPSTYAEAPSPVTMLLTGVMSKMGVYGFLRILLPIFPDQIRQVLGLLLGLAVATIVLSACAAFAQRDLKRMLAYSSVNHLGYCLLAMFAAAGAAAGVHQPEIQKAAALDGVLLQMFNHGLTASALFLLVALLEKRSGGLRGLDDFGGIRKVAPVFAGLMGIALFSSLGLPGLNGFIGEFLVFKGVFPLAPWAAAISTIGLLVTAIFLLTLIQRVFSGPLNARWAQMPDLTLAERLLVLPGIALMFVLGIWPQLILGPIDATVMELVKHLS